MENTEGLGREAEVWLDGHSLRVCDSISRPQKPCPAGILRDAKFTYASMSGFSWEKALGSNPSNKKLLDPVRRWSYVGFGQIVSIMPVVIDFGLLQMEDANWSNDETLIGRFVKVPIDRLEISQAREPDWPEEMR